MKLCKEKSFWQQDIKRREYVQALLKGAAVVGAVSYLFYDSIIMVLVLSPFLLYYMKSWIKNRIKKSKEEFTKQFKESILLLSSALSVGYSVENAIKGTERDLRMLYSKEERIVKEYTYMGYQLNMNIPAEQVLAEFAERVQTEDVDTFVEVFSSAKRSGGDSIAIIRNTVKMISEKIEVSREIELLLAAKKLEFKVMTAVPFVIILYMKLSFPEFMEVLYGNIAGICIMSCCLSCYGAAWQMGKKIIRIEV